MCTTILIGADRSALGTPMLAKNRDVEYGDVLGEGVVREGRTDYVFKGLSFRNYPDDITQGINEKGLALAYVFVKIKKPGWEEDWQPIAGATASQRLVGAIGREVLGGCATVEEAVRYVQDQAGRERCVGGTILFADAAKGAVVEAIDDEFAIHYVVSGAEVRTNHFLRLGERGPDFEAYPSSYARRARALALLSSRSVVNPKALVAMMSDHQHEPSEHSICRHGAPDDPLDHTTLASSILIPRNADGVPELLHASGHPCRHRYVSHVFG